MRRARPPRARWEFFKLSNASMFSIGVDALWLDGTEPEFYPHAGHCLALGSGEALFNAYSLLGPAPAPCA
jgi:alpha-glucosidase (family GH31 glycosyl hydrolase)